MGVTFREDKKAEEVREIGRRNVFNKRILKVFNEQYGRSPKDYELRRCGGNLNDILEAFVDYEAFVKFWGYKVTGLLTKAERSKVDSKLIKNLLENE